MTSFWPSLRRYAMDYVRRMPRRWLWVKWLPGLDTACEGEDHGELGMRMRAMGSYCAGTTSEQDAAVLLGEFVTFWTREHGGAPETTWKKLHPVGLGTRRIWLI